MDGPTLQPTSPHICGACECPIAPYRWAGNQHPTYGRQCNCLTPTSPSPVPDDSLCFVAKDAPALEAPERIDITPDTDMVERMALAAGGTVADLIAADVEEARKLLFDSMKTADRHGDSELHRLTAGLVSDIDDFRSIVAERSQS